MNFFIAIDTYEHIPRSLLSFKKKNAPVETRPATITIFTDEGERYVAQFRSAKIHDDKAWDGKIINPADYSYGRSYWDIVKGASAFITWHIEQWEENKLMCERTPIYYPPILRNLLNDIHEAIGSPVGWYKSYMHEEDKLVVYLPNTFFDRTENFTDNPHFSPGKKYTDVQKIGQFNRYKRCPVIKPSDMSAERSQKMRERYMLATQLSKTKS